MFSLLSAFIKQVKMRYSTLSLLGLASVVTAASYDEGEDGFFTDSQLIAEIDLFTARADVLSDFDVYGTIEADSPAETSYVVYLVKKYGPELLSIYSENGYTGYGVFDYFSVDDSILSMASIITTQDGAESTPSAQASNAAFGSVSKTGSSNASTTGADSAIGGSGSASGAPSDASGHPPVHGVTSHASNGSADATTAGSGGAGSGSTSYVASIVSSASFGGDAGHNRPLLAVGAVLGALPFFLL